MDIKILDSWLREFLVTKATPSKIAEYLSLCGPSVERVTKIGSDFVYNIEVTTNRVDSASVYGIAKEAAAILPRFGIAAKLNLYPSSFGKHKLFRSTHYLKAKVDPKLCPRFTAVLIKNVSIGDSTDEIKKRLESGDVRPINNIVDISNYIMLELGQPVHTFDYDKIKKSEMILRESKKGEKITTLDGKVFNLTGGDIVIEDGAGRLIDLAGVMGGNLSAVDEFTKNVLLFVQTYNPINIRKTSMSLSQRTMAATIFEKGTDPELVLPAILKGIAMFEKSTGGASEKEILDIYPRPFKSQVISTSYKFIAALLGIAITKDEISKYLKSLDFETKWDDEKLTVTVPSHRSNDISTPQDIVEEVARIYGYHNLPSQLMTGELTGRSTSFEFEFEKNIKNYLSGWGGSEVYTLSLTNKDSVSEKSLKLKNPLGAEGEYLRTSLMPSLISAANENIGTFDNFHLFEMANIYLPRKSDLPEERLILAGIFVGYKYRLAKGLLEALLKKVNITASFEARENNGFTAGKCAAILAGAMEIGKIGFVEKNNYIYYEFDVQKIYKLSQAVNKFIPIPKYPPQIEDITLTFPERTRLGDVVQTISNLNPLISSFELKDTFEDSYTFRVWYQSPEKTLTDKDVEEIRNKILSSIKTKFGGRIKE